MSNWVFDKMFQNATAIFETEHHGVCCKRVTGVPAAWKHRPRRRWLSVKLDQFCL